jgi:DNA-binding transcriptional MerR regulator
MGGISATRAAAILGMPYRTLDHWIRTGLLTIPNPAPGRGRSRELVFTDIVKAVTIKHLRQEGVTLQQIRRVLDELERRWQVVDPLLSGRLVVIGDRLLWAADEATLLDAITGQTGIRDLLVVDVGEMAQELAEKVTELAA